MMARSSLRRATKSRDTDHPSKLGEQVGQLPGQGPLRPSLVFTRGSPFQSSLLCAPLTFGGSDKSSKILWILGRLWLKCVLCMLAQKRPCQSIQPTI
eukprot:1102190-Amphidinium_carterae.1